MSSSVGLTVHVIASFQELILAYFENLVQKRPLLSRLALSPDKSSLVFRELCNVDTTNSTSTHHLRLLAKQT